MSSLAEILIIRGVMPIESLDILSGDSADDELKINNFVDRGIISGAQVASARAALTGLVHADCEVVKISTAASLTYPPPASSRYPTVFSSFPPPVAYQASAFAPPVISAPPAYPRPVAYAPPITVLEQLEEPARRATHRTFDGQVPELEGQRPIAMTDPDLVAVLQEVLYAAASDLHVSGGARPMVRVDGVLRPLDGVPVWSNEKVETALRSLLSAVQKTQFADKLELDFAYTLSSNARFRVNLYQQRGVIAGAFRVIPRDIRPLNELGLPDLVSRFSGLSEGLVLVTGPSGSGKSTTLAALVDLVNRTRPGHIVTVEDPIEFVHTNRRSLVNQREVGADTHSFAAALTRVLRQDPDVILIGELRDVDTMKVALHAAETGHLVFATLDTRSAPQAIDRIIHSFPLHLQSQVRLQLAATLQGVVCQALVKRANSNGRVVATEVLVATPAIAALIRESKTSQVPSLLQAGRNVGMQTMDQSLAELVNQREITQEAALENVQDIEGFRRHLILRPQKRLRVRESLSGESGARLTELARTP